MIVMASSPSIPAASVGDARRAGGDRTRRRLIEAAQQLIAERGESAVRLRDLTALAETNVAAVHYHFGGLRTLLAAAASEAVERIIAAQVAEVEALPNGASLDEIAAAYFRPMIKALRGPGSKGRPYVRVLSRVASDPPAELTEWAQSATARAHEALQVRLRPLLPDVSEDELLFRIKCIGAILVSLSVAAAEPDLRGKSPKQVERMLVPIVTGALAGGPTTGSLPAPPSRPSCAESGSIDHLEEAQ